MSGSIRESDIQSLWMPRPSSALPSIVKVTGGGTKRYSATHATEISTNHSAIFATSRNRRLGNDRREARIRAARRRTERLRSIMAALQPYSQARRKPDRAHEKGRCHG